MASITVINGPNLNMLGTREPELYGTQSLDDIMRHLKELAAARGAQLRSYQSNIEGELVTLIQEAAAEDGLILNAGAYTHTSIAIRDAVAAIPTRTIEVHLSNIHAREDFRHISLIAPVADGMISGLGTQGYALALDALLGETLL